VQAYNGSLWNTIFYWTHGQGDDDTWRQQTFDLTNGYLVDDFKLRFISRESLSSEEGEIDDVLIEVSGESSAGGGDTGGDTGGDDGGTEPPPPPPPNVAPTANAGSDKTVNDADNTGAEQVTLSGAASSDSDGTIVSYEWKEGGTVLGSSVSVSPSFSVGTHTVTLTVTDDDGASHSDTVLVTVTPFVAPLPPPPPPSGDLFFDDFQGGLSKWSQTGDGQWSATSPAESSVPGSSGGNQVAQAERCRNSCTLTMQNGLNLSGLSNVVLSFWRFVDQSIDSGEYLQIQAYNGSSWDTIFSWSGGNGDDDTWHFESYALPVKYLFNGFKIRLVSSESSSIEETEVDDLKISGQ